MFNEPNTQSVFTEFDRGYADYNYGESSPLSIAMRKNDYKAFLHEAQYITEDTDVRVAHLCDRIHAQGLA